LQRTSNSRCGKKKPSLNTSKTKFLFRSTRDFFLPFFFLPASLRPENRGQENKIKTEFFVSLTKQAMNHYTSSRSGRRAARRAASPEPHERWLISYADLVTLLFTLFVVLYAAADHDRASKVAEAVAAVVSNQGSASGNGILPGGKTVNPTQEAMERVFAAHQTLRARARIIGTKDGFTVSLAEAGFFAPGEAAIREDARALVEVIADALRDSPAQLRIEGHTDSTPIATSRYPSNWELSSARAAVVLAQFVARGIPPARLSLAGYAGERPIAANATPEGRALNRRVDLVILHGAE
jgi:chemotaxis protein MotB